MIQEKGNELWKRRVSSGMKEDIPGAGAAAESGMCVCSSFADLMDGTG